MITNNSLTHLLSYKRAKRSNISWSYLRVRLDDGTLGVRFQHTGIALGDINTKSRSPVVAVYLRYLKH